MKDREVDPKESSFTFFECTSTHAPNWETSFSLLIIIVFKFSGQSGCVG